jgi:hypothetical protein
MTTLTIEIDKKEDLSNLTEYIDRLGLRYEVEEDEDADFEYTDEVKRMLDERYEDCINGKNMISAEESQRQIRELLASRK